MTSLFTEIGAETREFIEGGTIGAGDDGNNEFGKENNDWAGDDIKCDLYF